MSAYLSGKQVSLTETEREPLPFNMDTDYDFLVRQAQYTGCEFFIFAGKAYFREPAKLTTPVMTLEPQHGILSATMSLRGAPLVKKVTVRGVDPESDKAVSGSATSSGKFGDGSGPSKMLSGHGAHVLRPARRQREGRVRPREGPFCAASSASSAF